MKIAEFVNDVKNGEKAASNLMITKKYISSDEKVRLAKTVIDDSVEYDRGFIKCDSYKKHLSFIFGFIELHTDLCFADDWIDKMQEYDALCENGLIDVIIGSLRDEYENALMILDMLCNDVLADNSIEASVARLTQSVSENLDVLVGALTDKLEDFDIEKIIPKDLDLNKLTRLLNKVK
jgi:hypothetical protein